MKLPLRNQAVEMHNNQDVAELHVDNLKIKFQRNLSFLEDYNGFKNIVKKKYADHVPTEQLDHNDNRV